MATERLMELWLDLKERPQRAADMAARWGYPAEATLLGVVAALKDDSRAVVGRPLGINLEHFKG
jgi:hypothetical protein